MLRPWKWFKELYYNIRNAHDRATKGYCYLNYISFNEWFTQIAPSMLRDIADKGWGYPGVKPFDSPERWHNWLHKTADEIEWCSETWRDENNINEYKQPYEDDLEKRIQENPKNWLRVNGDKELFDKYYQRDFELHDEGREKIKEALASLAEHWDSLWD